MKRTISLFLAVIMLITLVPFSAFSVNAAEYSFTINGVDIPIEEGWVVVCTSLESWANCTPDWSNNLQLTPDGDGYKVVWQSVCPAEYNAFDPIEASGFSDVEGDLYVILHGGADNVNAYAVGYGMDVTIDNLATGGTITFSGEVSSVDTSITERIDLSGNIALGKSYTTSLPYRMGSADMDWAYDENAEITYPDEGGITLTDGIIASSGDYMNNAWLGLHYTTPDAIEKGYTWVTLDLEGSCHINEVQLYVPTDLEFGVVTPSLVSFWASDDGVEYYEIGSVSSNEAVVVNDFTAVMTVTCDISARYIEARITHGGFDFISEIAVIGIEGEEPTVDEVDPDTSFDFEMNISVPESYTPGEMLYVTVTVDNITADNGLESVFADLLFDNSKLEVISMEDGSSAIDAFQEYAEWVDLSKFYALEDGTIIVMLIAGTPGTPEGYFTEATEDGQLTFIVPFMVKADAVGNLAFTIEDSTVNGEYINMQTGEVFAYNGKGSTATISTTNKPDSSEQTFTDDQGVTYTLSDDGTYYIVSDCDESVTSVVIPAEYNGTPVTAIGPLAFRYCYDLAGIEIPDSIEIIGEWAFEWCHNLTDVQIPSSVTTLSDYAFSNCKALTSIVIPKSLVNIARSPFGGCSAVESIIVEQGNAVYHSKNNCLIETASNTLISGFINSVIPDYVTSIGTYAFADLKELTSMVLPNSIDAIDYGAFAGCTALANIQIPDSVSTIGGYAFTNCNSLESITIPNAVTNIDSYAFEFCENLTDIYCEAETQPEGWHETWLEGCTATVHWGYGKENEDTSSEPEVSEPEEEVIYEIEEDTNIEIEANDAFEPGTIVTVIESIVEDVKETINEVLDIPVTIGGYNGTISDLLFGGNVKNQIFDFNAEKDGEAVQPKKPIVINIPIPEGYSDKVSVKYLSPDGTLGDVKHTVDKKNRKVTATIEHFSYYVLIDEGDLEYTLGDINDNGKIDMTDYILLKRAYFGTYKFTEAQNKVGDINKNNKIDMTDYILLKRVYFGTYKL